MPEIPDLVTAHDDRIIFADRFRLVERESAGEGEVGDGSDETPRLFRISSNFIPWSPFRKLRLQRAADLGAPHALAIMVEQLRFVAALTKRFDQGTGLPVGAVIDALVKGEDADFHG